MERTHHQTSNCPIGRTLALLGEKWTLLIIREAFCGSTRFEQFQRVLQCPRNLLTTRLNKLVDERILERSEYREPGRRTRNEYHLTPRGHDLGPILFALRDWGDRHEGGPEGPPIVLRHADCGEEVHLAVRCAAGHDVDDHAEVEVVDGPGALPPVPA